MVVVPENVTQPCRNTIEELEKKYKVKVLAVQADVNAGADNESVVNNVIKMCGARCKLPKNRAYFVAEELKNLTLAPAPMPGRRRITMGAESENTATGVEGIIVPEGQTIKVISNGQLIIIRNGEKFNAQGIKL